MTIEPNVSTTAAAGVADDSVPALKPPVDSAALRHKDLLDGEFWRRVPAFAEVDADTFLDWKWQLRNSVVKPDQLFKRLSELVSDAFVEDVRRGFGRAPMALRVSPYLLSLIDWDNPYEDPLRRQFIPVASALLPDHPQLTLDSLHEQADAPTPGLTHRYFDKALFLALDTCPVYCRFCTRSYAVGLDTEKVEKVGLRVNRERWERAFRYVASRPELEDIVISGGDSYQLKPEQVREIGARLLDMPNIRRLRFATKGPAVMPMKLLTHEEWLDALTSVVEKGRRMHKAVVVHTHFNHPNEITAITQRALNRLFERGVVVRNQAVLQNGVNDDAETMILLAKRLGHVNVIPYYVYMHDLVSGVEDLRTPLQTGIDIEKHVRGSTAGFNCPLFVVDAPGGGGKRDVHSYEVYDRENGIAVYRAPSVRPGQLFLYFDPLRFLAEEAQERWKDPATYEPLIEAAKEKASAV